MQNLIKLGKPKVIPVTAMVIAGALLASAVTWYAVTSQEQRYWVVTSDTPLGTELSSVELNQISANLFASKNNYISSAARPEGFLTRSVRAGELLNRESISPISVGQFARIVVPSSSSLPSTLDSGVSVQVWVAENLGSEYSLATQLLDAAEVVKRVESDSMFRNAKESVEIQVAAEALPALLDALANGSAIYLVPNS